MGNDLFYVRETLFGELPAGFAGVEYQAGGPAVRAGVASGTRVYHPGLLFLIADQFVAVSIDDQSGIRVARPHAGMARHGAMFVTVQNHHVTTGQTEHGFIVECQQRAVLPVWPELRNIVVATDGDELVARSVHGIEDLAVHNIAGMHGDITLGEYFDNTLIKVAMCIRDDTNANCREAGHGLRLVNRIRIRSES